MTQKRAAILQILQESGHLPADEIFRRVKEKYPGIVLATVYNNLHALTELGLIRRIKTTDGSDFYDKTPTPHEHAVCDRCGAMLDVMLEDLPSLLREKSSLPILSYDLIVHTCCPACAAQEAK